MSTRRPGGYVALLALVLILAFTIETLSKGSHSLSGIPVGKQLPAFAAPLALSSLNGDVNVARHYHEGAAGSVPACTVRGPDVLNVCEEWEKGPVVLALFIDGSACTGVLPELQRLHRELPELRTIAVAIKGERDPVRHTIHQLHLTYPVGLDPDGILASLYAVGSCPQVSFAYKGGTVQSRALLVTPTYGELKQRAEQLIAASAARSTS